MNLSNVLNRLNKEDYVRTIHGQVRIAVLLDDSGKEIEQVVVLPSLSYGKYNVLFILPDYQMMYANTEGHEITRALLDFDNLAVKTSQQQDLALSILGSIIEYLPEPLKSILI